MWRTAELVRLGIRFSSPRSLCQPCSILMKAPLKDRVFPVKKLAHNLSLKGSAVSSVRFYSQERTDSEEHPSSLPPAEVQAGDDQTSRSLQTKYFLESLHQCTSPVDVLDFSIQHAVTFRHVSSCLVCMWSSTKKMTEEQRNYELQLAFEHPGFEPLLQKVMRSAGYMRSRDLGLSLLSMLKLGVPQQSRVIQTLLRCCQETLNDFDERALSVLATCLEHLKDSPNVSSLRDGVRLVFEIRLPEIKDVFAFQTMMRVLGKDAPPAFRRKLEVKALSMIDQFNPINCQHMICNMATMELHSRPLLEICSKKVRENLHGIPFNRLVAVLMAYKDLSYRDFGLFTDISDHLASVIDIFTNKQVVLFLSVFEKFNFSPDALMEAFAEKVIADPDSLTLRHLVCVLKVYSSLNYDLQHRRQQFLDSVTRVLESYLPNMSKPELLKCVYSLCQLNHFPPAPLELLLQESTLEQLKTTTPKSLRHQDMKLRLVDMCLRLDRPPLPQPLTVPSSDQEDSSVISSSENPVLSQLLQEMFGDQEDRLLQQAVVEENFYVIDGVITKVRPPAAEAASPAGEEGSPAESSRRVAVFGATSSSFCFGTSHPRGLLATKIRHLRILGYDPVLVIEPMLRRMPQEQRTEFLREQIFPDEHQSETRSETEKLES
ncbi:FAST kinase domain-containing protein 2%2C mitochondrial isoform X1 [Xyrichtys novacula]|uniref:FAST kinase domain-containing protein 2, mitochondrial isoform X1 n=1 Tax=Xyrichtys novacula TaxID=13765 RepID=A0AAV1HP07_XYRNO|nr:FAST kinase domain-containing protein 2%2C mitochondrial isoform X1 [Xyrichtys novacula]